MGLIRERREKRKEDGGDKKRSGLGGKINFSGDGTECKYVTFQRHGRVC